MQRFTSGGLLWLLFVLALGGGILLLLAYTPGPRPPFLVSQQPPTSTRAHTLSQGEGFLELAGSGSNLPLMRALGRRYLRRFPGRRLRVHASIGSTGGVRALRDGVVRVGLLSRELRPNEQHHDLLIAPYARVAVVFAAHRSVPMRNLSKATILSLYEGRLQAWRRGLPVVVFQRERGDSGHLAVGRQVPSFRRVNERAYRAARWRVLYRDQAMQRGLLSQEGAIGVFDLGAITSQQLPLKVLAYAGVQPSVATLATGRYPFAKTLSFAINRRAKADVRHFLAFVYSRQSQQAMRQLGYLPLPRPTWLKGTP